MSLAWVPFLTPLPLEDVWLLLVAPLALAVAVVYKTIKLQDLSQLPRQAAMLAGQIVVFMIAAAAVLWLVTELV